MSHTPTLAFAMGSLALVVRLARRRQTDHTRAFDRSAPAFVRDEMTRPMWNEVLRSFSPSALHCLFLGHDDTLAREPKRLFLRCDTCGRQTRGWTIGRPPRTPERAPSRNAISRRPLWSRIVRLSF